MTSTVVHRQYTTHVKINKEKMPINSGVRKCFQVVIQVSIKEFNLSSLEEGSGWNCFI